MGKQQAVLVVDDDPDVRDTTVMMLQSRGYSVLAVEDAQMAYDAYMADRCAAERHIGAVVSDVMMPGMSGPELYLKIKEVDPRPPFCFVSGAQSGTAASLLRGIRQQDGVPLLPKPYNIQTLADTVDALMNKRLAMQERYMEM